MVGSGVVVNTIGISAIKLLHAVELSLLLVAVFKYIAKNFDNRLASVMYLVGYQLSNQLGAAIPCCAMLSHLISCYSVLSHAMLCYAMLWDSAYWQHCIFIDAFIAKKMYFSRRLYSFCSKK